jgi:hypothetical protein
MTRRILALCAALAAAPLGACSSLPFVLGGASLAQSAPQTTADAEKALTLVHFAYDGAGIALKHAAESGALKGADAANAKALYDRAGTALDAADQADAAANAPGVLAAVADTGALLIQIHALIANK